LALEHGCKLTDKTGFGNTVFDLACDHADLTYNKWISSLDGAQEHMR
jgi:hypothetical protein